MDVKPQSLKNLRPIKKGEVRNPKGKPKGCENWSTVLKRLLREIDPKKDKAVMDFFGFDLPPRLLRDYRTLQQYMTLTLLSKASKGDLKAIEMVLERCDGGPIQRQETMDLTPRPLFLEDSEDAPFGFQPEETSKPSPAPEPPHPAEPVKALPEPAPEAKEAPKAEEEPRKPKRRKGLRVL